MGGCDKPDDSARQQQVDKWRSKYVARFGGTAKDFSEMLAVYINREDREKQQEAVCKTLKPQGGPSATREIERALYKQLSCIDALKQKYDEDPDVLLYWTDRPGASEIARAASTVDAYSSDDTFGRSTRASRWSSPTPRRRSVSIAQSSTPSLRTRAITRLPARGSTSCRIRLASPRKRGVRP
jgi:hypothetical protein